MIIYDYIWLYMIIYDYICLYMIIYDYIWLYMDKLYRPHVVTSEWWLSQNGRILGELLHFSFVHMICELHVIFIYIHIHIYIHNTLVHMIHSQVHTYIYKYTLLCTIIQDCIHIIYTCTMSGSLHSRCVNLGLCWSQWPASRNCWRPCDAVDYHGIYIGTYRKT